MKFRKPNSPTNKKIADQIRRFMPYLVFRAAQKSAYIIARNAEVNRKAAAKARRVAETAEFLAREARAAQVAAEAIAASRQVAASMSLMDQFRARAAARIAEAQARIDAGCAQPADYWIVNEFSVPDAIEYAAPAARACVGQTVDEFASRQFGAELWASAPEDSRQWLLNKMFSSSSYGVEFGRIANTARHWHESAQTQ